MSKLIVRGPVSISGEVAVRGAKNAALPILIASAMGSGSVVLKNMPTELNDVRVALESLESIGCKMDIEDGLIKMQESNITNTSISEELAGRFHYSLLFLGLLVGKYGHAKISMPGGCDIGNRKFDLHLEGLKKLGAHVHVDNHSIEVTAEKLLGTDISLYLPTTSGTENIMLAACFAEGTTRIYNANTRPEVRDLGDFLNAMGAKVTVKNRVVEVQPIAQFQDCEYRIMPGWDEAITYLIAGSITGGEICVKDFSLLDFPGEVSHLRAAGIDVFEWGGSVYATARNKQLKAFDLFTGPYPGVNSDMQPLFAALASQCDGESSITDQRFTERFAYTREMKKMGMMIDNYGNSAIIRGPVKLKGNKVRALDLRCGAALILSALVAEGITVIDNCYQIDRGYEQISSKLNDVGADVEKIEE